jgi:hypothetical protein
VNIDFVAMTSYNFKAECIDETVHKILDDKQCVSNYIVDGRLDLHKNPELFEKLLGKTT